MGTLPVLTAGIAITLPAASMEDVIRIERAYMHYAVDAVAFVAVFLGVIAFFLSNRLRMRLLALLVLGLCVMFYLLQLHVL